MQMQQSSCPKNKLAKQRNIRERTFFDNGPIIYLRFHTTVFRCRGIGSIAPYNENISFLPAE